MLNPVTPEFEARLRAQLPPACFRDDARFFEEPRRKWQGHGLVVAPDSTEDVSAIVRACAAARVAVVPYSGGTGLVGGQIVTQDQPRPVVLALERMNRIRSRHPQENVLVAEAGCILADVQRIAGDMDRLFPLSLTSEGSARIGGLLSTNAGGINTLRYGTARAQCLGVEAVMPDGSVLHGLTRLRKDNTGYDLRDLLIGAEGSLGVITASALRLVPRPVATATALMVVRDPDAALTLLSRLGEKAGESISAFELLHGTGFAFMDETGIAYRRPFDHLPDWSVLIELGMGEGQDPRALLQDLFTEAHGLGLVSDGVIAASGAQSAELWRIRESIPAANARVGAISSHDVALPLSAIPEFIARGVGAIAAIGPFRVNAFGHLGDGNLHYNVFPPRGQSPRDFDALRPVVMRAVHDLVMGYGGSFSAEHGLGRLKPPELERYGDPTKRAVMRAIKSALDPLGIMNPGAVLGV